LINLILNFFLISNYGVYGAASATMYTYIVIFVFLFLYLLKNSSNDSFYKINKNLSSNL
jgi:Na+-driven multidrug efflux pump